MKYPKEFTDWWTAYPRKAAKKVSFLKWELALQDIQDNQDCTKDEAKSWLLERTKLFAQSPKAKGEFCPYPSTWLYQGRYDDDIDEWGGKNSKIVTDIEKLQEWRP